MAGKKSVHFSKSADQTLYINQSSEEEDADDEESFADEEEQTHEEETNHEKIASGDGSVTNPAWADAMAKLLGSAVSKKSGFMLAKAKKDRDLVDKPKPVSSFEVVSEDGKADVVTSQAKSNDDSGSKKKGRVNPKTKVLEETLKTVDKCDREKELRLAAIATKGVVQLFNAVNAQLNQIEKKIDDAGPLEGKQRKARESIDEKSFMQTLEKMNEDVAPAPEDEEEEEEEREEPRKKRSRKKDKSKEKSQNFSKVFSDNFAVAL